MSKSQDANIFGALCYLPIIGVLVSIIFFVIKNDDKFVRYHALQSILFSLLMWVTGTVLTITILGVVLLPIVWLVLVIACLYSMYAAYQGKMHELPIVGKFVKNM